MLLTIFTPTYNRANKLENVYNSLKNQISSEYEWLIVDDGSIDNTKKIVEKFINDYLLNVRYIKKDNGGKHTAHNLAVDEAKGKYFMCLDSDDFLKENTINSLLEKLKICKKNEGIISYKENQNQHMLSDYFPNKSTIDCIYDLEMKYNCKGEFVFIFPTSVLKKNKFPIYKDEKFITEAVLYDKLKCSMILYPHVIQVCEYQTNGLSNNLNRIMKKNPSGYCLYFMQRIDIQLKLTAKIVMAAKYVAFYFFSKKNKIKYNGENFSIVIISIPLGLLFWLYYKIIRDF